MSSPGLAWPQAVGALPDLGLGTHRCGNCRLTLTTCVCADAPRVDTRATIVLVMHFREWRRASNTGHFARLAMPERCHIRLHGLPHQPVNLDEFTNDQPTLALYPGLGAKILTPELLQSLPGPPTLLVPDGNWTQARNMMRRIPAMAAALPVCLPGPTSGARWRPRRNAFPDRMATFEALAEAIGVIEGAAAQDKLLEFFWRAADRMLTLRGYPKLPGGDH